MTRVQLAQGVNLTYLPARKFKTSLLSAQFVTPLRWETAGANALLAAVLLTALNRLLKPGCENNLSKPQSEENEVLRILSKRRSGA